MSAKTFSELRDEVRGEVVAPEDADYEDARRVHNGMIDRRPAVVVRVMNAGDVMATVHYAARRRSRRGDPRRWPQRSRLRHL